MTDISQSQKITAEIIQHPAMQNALTTYNEILTREAVRVLPSMALNQAGLGLSAANKGKSAASLIALQLGYDVYRTVGTERNRRQQIARTKAVETLFDSAVKQATAPHFERAQKDKAYAAALVESLGALTLPAAKIQGTGAKVSLGTALAGQTVLATLSARSTWQSKGSLWVRGFGLVVGAGEAASGAYGLYKLLKDGDSLLSRPRDIALQKALAAPKAKAAQLS